MGGVGSAGFAGCERGRREGSTGGGEGREGGQEMRWHSSVAEGQEQKRRFVLVAAQCWCRSRINRQAGSPRSQASRPTGPLPTPASLPRLHTGKPTYPPTHPPAHPPTRLPTHPPARPHTHPHPPARPHTHTRPPTQPPTLWTTTKRRVLLRELEAASAAAAAAAAADAEGAMGVSRPPALPPGLSPPIPKLVTPAGGRGRCGGGGCMGEETDCMGAIAGHWGAGALEGALGIRCNVARLKLRQVDASW